MTFYILLRGGARKTVYIRVRHLGREFFISTGIHADLPLVGGRFQRKESLCDAKNKALARIIGLCEDYGLKNATIPFETARSELASLIQGKERVSKDKLTDQFDAFISTLDNKSTQIVYRTTLGKVTEYDKDITLASIDVAWLEAFERWLRGQGLSVNYISIQLRNIRAVFNFAINNGVTDNYPFRRFKIKSEQTDKRNVSVETLRLIRDAEIHNPYLAEYRDMFMLMVYLIGINAADLFTLPHSALKDGRISYRRAKTGTLYSVKVEPEAQEIIDRYRGKRYLLCPLDRYTDYKSYLGHLNRGLKNIGKEYHQYYGYSGRAIAEGLSSYWSRHTWATISASIGVPIDVISLALGHSFGNKVTQIYVEWGRGKVDEANRMVIDYINGK